jgi:glycoside hydrolase-like protein
MTVNRLWIAHCFFACFALACLSGLAEAQTRMGLVSPGVGWAVLSQGTVYSPNDHLFWTSNDGGAWNDITPQDPTSKEIAGVFFLDASRGWVLLTARGTELIGPSNVSGFDLATTTDGGADWTVKHVASPQEDHGWAGVGELFFLDSSHGWLNLELALHDWAVGTLLATTDGGNTWTQAKGFNVDAGYGPIRFTDPQNGWVAGGPYGQRHLYATHDGGRSWQDTALAPPPRVSSYVGPISQCNPPAFKDAKHGFVPVTYTGTDASGSDFKVVALFSTDDGGRAWHLESWVNLGEDRGVLAFTAVDSQAIAPKLLSRSGLTLVKLSPAGKAIETVSTELPQMRGDAALLGLNFSDATHGWASSSDGRLLSTSDGGLTWKDMTPGQQKKASLLAPSNSTDTIGSSGTPLQSSLVASSASGPIAASSTITTYKSRHLGFDICALPTTGQMSTWWSSSPYFDYGVYIGGADTRCASVTSSWVKTVTGQGWGLIPIWVGPQAPCTCPPNGGTWPNCNPNWASTISTNGGAYAQGQAEADAATKGTRSAMQKLGLGSGSPVYFDIENYTPSATCNGNPTGSYVNSFLSGWVSEIQQNGYIAAVYGNPTPAESWYIGGTGYSAVSPSPNDVWIPKYDNRVTIWGLTGLDDAAWPTHQRMHQYVGNQAVKWGGLQLQVDTDIEDADVTGGNGAKSYSFSYNAAIDYPGIVGSTYPYGINNKGQIVGFYADSMGVYHGFSFDGITFTTIDFPGATATEATSVNNAGNIVGFYSDVGGHIHAFLNQGGTFGTYTSFDYPSATSTSAVGINDDNQISGYYTDSLGTYHGFLDQAGNFTNIDYPGATGTDLHGINGDAQIAGGCPNGDCPSFLYYQGTFSYPPLANLAEVNNNDQITGTTNPNVLFQHEGSSITLACPGGSSVNPATGLSDFILNSQTSAKVAIVGSCVISGVLHGFLATSQ